MTVWDWASAVTGIGDQTGAGYSFWSGMGSCLTEFAIVGAVWRHMNCGAKGCWRIGRHPVAGTPYHTCRKHHPVIPDNGATVEQIHAAHHDLG